MNRLLAVLLVATCLFSDRAQAQSDSGLLSELDLVAWGVEAIQAWTSSPSAAIPTARFDGSVPLEQLLPQTTPDSRIRFVAAQVGMRDLDNEQQTVWALSLLDLMLQRAWWSGAVRLVDVQSGTFLQHDRTWFEIGTGPGFHVQSANSAVSGGMQVFGGRRAAGLHDFDIGAMEGSGWHGGVRLHTAINLRKVAILSARAGKTGFTSGQLVASELGATLAIRLTNQLKLKGVLRHVSNAGTSVSSDYSSTLMGIGVGYRLNRRDRD